jgi:hypothetical protein
MGFWEKLKEYIKYLPNQTGDGIIVFPNPPNEKKFKK